MLWLGIESDGVNSFLDPVGYAKLDETGFPVARVWVADRIPAQDLAAFGEYYREDTSNDGYDYWAPLAWTGLLVTLLAPAPPAVTVLAGFSGGDWLTFPVSRRSPHT